jgi:rhodanese-related sulfurtransferase
MIVTAGPISASGLFIGDWIADVLWIGCAIAGVLLVRRCVARVAFRSSVSARTASVAAVRQSLFVVATTGAVAITYHTFGMTGFIKHPAYVQAVERDHAASFMPKISLREMESTVKRGALLVDARFVSDYAAGHIPHAINVPVRSEAVERARLLAGVARTRPIIVYCESRGCPFAQHIAANLWEDGYVNVKLLDGGYEEWMAFTRASHE